jgi:hypothetical protein
MDPRTYLPALAGLFLASLTAACSSSSGGPDGGCAPYQVPSSFDPTTPVVSFQNDVVTPIFRPHCGLSAACHQLTTGAVSGLYLGSNATSGSADVAKVYANLVGKPSVDLPTMNLVTAGDDAHSFILHKLDGDQCVFDPQCVDGDCLSQMPQNSTPLDVPTRDTIRRWIAQGAPNN